MKLESIKILNYKSIHDINIIFKDNITCLVGKNESGKSNILEAITYLDLVGNQLSGKLTNKRYRINKNTLPGFSALFLLSTLDKENLIKWVDKEKIVAIVDKAIDNWQNKTEKIKIKRWGNGVDNINIDFIDKEGRFLCNFHESIVVTIWDKFLSDFCELFLPDIELFTDEELELNPASLSNLDSQEKEFNTFRKLLKVSGVEDFESLFDDEEGGKLLKRVGLRITDLFKKFYLQDNSIEISIQMSKGDKLNIVIHDSTEETFSVSERSPGFKYFFAFLINKIYNKKFSNKSQILLLDEPGNHLHPQGCRDLLTTFNDISSESQIIYTAHNPFLVIRNDLDSIIFVKKSGSGNTENIKNPYNNKYQALRKELGILLGDSFLVGEYNIVVEGTTEAFALPILKEELIEFGGNNKYRKIEFVNIYDSETADKIPSALRYLKSLDLKGSILLDSDNKGRQIVNKIRESLNQDWALFQINDAFVDKDKVRTFEDLFPQKLYITSFNDYYNDLNTIENIFKDGIFIPFNINNLEIETPIVDKLNAHFQTLFGSDGASKTYSKKNVMRVLLSKLLQLPVSQKLDYLSHIRNIFDNIIDHFISLEGKI